MTTSAVLLASLVLTIPGPGPAAFPAPPRDRTSPPAPSQDRPAPRAPFQDRPALRSPFQSRQPLPAPYQIDGIEEDLSERMSTDPRVLIRVDLGSAEGRPVPALESLERFTLVGTGGTVLASVHDIEKSCAYLCGDEGETCHYVARVTSHRPLEEIGTPLAALPGEVTLEAFATLVAEPMAMPDDWPPGSWARPVWPEDPEPVAEHRLLPPEGGGSDVQLETRVSSRTWAIEGRDCRRLRYGDLEALHCSALAAILAGGRPLLVSVADYNLPAAEPVASFVHGGDSYRLVRLGLKAQTVYGLLVHTAAGWRGIFRPRDYPLLC